jgi:hypothetical protein
MWQCGQCGTQNDEKEPVCVYCGCQSVNGKPSLSDRLLRFLSQKKAPDIYQPFEVTKPNRVIKTFYHAAQALVIVVFIAFIYLRSGSGLFDEIAYRVETRAFEAAESYNERVLTAINNGEAVIERAESEWETDIADSIDGIVNERVSGLRRRAAEIIEYIRGMF